MADWTTLGLLVRAAREQQHLTLYALSRRVSDAGQPLDRRYLERVERGDRVPTEALMACVARVLARPDLLTVYHCQHLTALVQRTVMRTPHYAQAVTEAIRQVLRQGITNVQDLEIRRRSSEEDDRPRARATGG